MTHTCYNINNIFYSSGFRPFYNEEIPDLWPNTTKLLKLWADVYYVKFAYLLVWILLSY